MYCYFSFLLSLIIPPEIQIIIQPCATDTKQSDTAAKCATKTRWVNNYICNWNLVSGPIKYHTGQWLIDYDWVRDLMVPMHLVLNWWALCTPYRCMGALLLYWSSRWPPDLYS